MTASAHQAYGEDGQDYGKNGLRVHAGNYIMVYTIYALIDPRTDAMFYIGISDCPEKSTLW
jgi:hypothetical protein